jgi:molecular chaperone GrpE
VIESTEGGMGPDPMHDTMKEKDMNSNQNTNKDQPHAEASTAPMALEDLQKRVDELEAQLKEKEAQAKEKESKYVYLYAEFDNFKKRAIKERSDLIKFGWEPVARDLLQNLDDLERALSHIPPTVDKNLALGLQMVANQYKSTLQKQGVQPVESLQKEFDPNFHEAVGQEESDAPENTIIHEHTRGYTLHGRLLRPSQVTVSAGRPQANGKSS